MGELPSRPKKILRTEDGRIGGAVVDLDGELVILKTVDPARHLLRSVPGSDSPGYAFDGVVLDAGESVGARRAVVEERVSKRRWSVPLATLRRLGVDIDYGHGRQVALPLPCWASQMPKGPRQERLF